MSRRARGQRTARRFESLLMRYCTSRVVRFKAKASPGESGFLESEPPEQRGERRQQEAKRRQQNQGASRGVLKQSQEEREVMV
jgi:hypothetical protein